MKAQISNKVNISEKITKSEISMISKIKLNITNDEFSIKSIIINTISRIYAYMICVERNNKDFSLIEIKTYIREFYTFLINYKNEKIVFLYSMYFNIIQKLTLLLNWVLFYFFGKILAFYSIYKILITLKNYFLSNYSEINIMLKNEVINIIDKMLSVGFFILKFDNESLIYNLLEQYFSLILLGSLLLVNMRSFLNTIHFLYTRAIYKISFNKQVEVLFMSYFIGMFYISACVFVIFSLPLRYRTNLVYIYTQMDYSLLKFYSDKTFLVSVVVFSLIELIFIGFFLVAKLDLKRVLNN